MQHGRVMMGMMVGLVWLVSAPLPAAAQLGYPLAATKEEQLAELGIFLAEFDLNQVNGAPACHDMLLQGMPGYTPKPQQQALCERQQERIALLRERHAAYCNDLKVQGGKYGCK